MNYQATFQRYEIKYMLSLRQKQAMLEAMKDHMQLDHYGRSAVKNLYFDTDSYRLIRRSLEKPLYKEKLRLRSYGATEGQAAFLELKKKFDGVVYKRRMQLPEQVAIMAMQTGEPLPETTQIAREIDCFRNFYGPLKPKVFLSYQREAYYAVDSRDLRITFDDTIVYRRENLCLQDPGQGQSILPPGYVLMEIKTSGGMPLWLTKFLNENRIFKTSFSKYGNAYLDMLQKGELSYV